MIDDRNLDEISESAYHSPLHITEEIRQNTERRERRAKELGISLYILGDDLH